MLCGCVIREDEGRDLARKRGTEFKLPYAIIDNDITVNSSFDEFTSSNISSSSSAVAAKPARTSRSSKRSNKTQLRDYLQTGRKRKTPYHDLYAGLVSPYAAVAAAAVAGSSLYPPLPGSAGCYTAAAAVPSAPCHSVTPCAEVKPEMLYPYACAAGMASQNLSSTSAFEDQYRFGYHPTATALYPGGYSTSGSGDFRFDDRHHAYYGANGLCAYTGYGDHYAAGRSTVAAGFQYANYGGLQQDFNSGDTTSSTSPSTVVSRYRSSHGRQMSAAAAVGYGLDLSTRSQYDRDVIALYDPTDGMRRRHNGGGSADFATSGLVGTAFDPLLTTSACLYNGTGAMFDGGRGVLPSLGADGAACSPPTSCCDVYGKTASGDCYDEVSPQSDVISTHRSGGDYTVIRKTGYASPTTPPRHDCDTTAVHWPTATGARDVINRPPVSASPYHRHTSSPTTQQQHDDVATTQPSLQCNCFISLASTYEHRGGSKGRGRKHVPPKTPNNFFTNVILHRRVLFYKFMDIMALRLPHQCPSQSKILDSSLYERALFEDCQVPCPSC